MSTQIMYMESKDTGCQGEARIARLTLTSSFSHVLRYGDKLYQPHKDRGSKANYYEVGTGTWYWINRCQKDGMDSIEPRQVSIDQDVQQEYWEKIRRNPDMAGQSSFHSPGKVVR